MIIFNSRICVCECPTGVYCLWRSLISANVFCIYKSMIFLCTCKHVLSVYVCVRVCVCKFAFMYIYIYIYIYQYSYFQGCCFSSLALSFSQYTHFHMNIYLYIYIYIYICFYFGMFVCMWTSVYMCERKVRETEKNRDREKERVGWKVHRLRLSLDDIISVVDDFFTNGIQALQHWWKKFMNCKGNHVEE